MPKVTGGGVWGILLLSVISIAALVRVAYITYAGGGVVIEPDTQGYYIEKNFFTDDFIHNFFNVNRTPGYIMLTSLAMDATIHTHPLYKSPEFFNGIQIMVVVQTIFGLLGLLILYDTFVSLRITRILSLAFTLFTSLNIYQFIWERAVLTEALYIFILICMMRLFVSLLYKPTVRITLLLTLFGIFGFLLRPAGLCIPLILLPCVWLIHRTKKVVLIITTALCIYISIPLLMVGMNNYLYGFKGLSINTDFAVFGRILHYNIPVTSARTVEPLYSEVVSYRAIGGNISIPWYFFVFYNNEIYNHMDRLQTLNKLVLKSEWPQFFRTVLGEVPIAFFDTNMYEVMYRGPVPGFTRSFFDLLTYCYSVLQHLTIIALLFIPMSVIVFIKKQSVMHTFIMAIAAMVLYQLFSSLIWGGAWEWARHMITTQTYLFFFCFWWLVQCIRWIRRRMIQ